MRIPLPSGGIRPHTLVHFHGNGEIVDDYLGDFVELIGRMGCSSFLVGYRGYGRSPGVPRLARFIGSFRE
jgi:hypothetical protein